MTLTLSGGRAFRLLIIIALAAACAAAFGGAVHTSTAAAAAPPAVDSCGYPDATNGARSGTAFNESDVLAGFSTTGSGASTKVIAWYTDEHAMTLGTGPNVTQMTADPDHATNPNTGDSSAMDPAGRPLYPAMYVTDITGAPASRSGDWQQKANNSGAVAPDDVFGTWKTSNANDPAKNTTFGPGADTPPAGIKYEDYRTEVRWDLSSFGLPGHSYRVQVMVHDGDQNKNGGDVGEACTTITIGKVAPAISTNATPYATTSGTISDTAHVTGGSSPTGTVDFRIYADSACTGPGTLVGSGTLDANGNATSPAYSPPGAGHYYWRAFYNGDVANGAVSGPCGAANEDSLVATPHLTIVKEVSKDGGQTWHKSVTVHAGDSVQYRFVVTNDGDVGTDLTGVHVNELTGIADCDGNLHATSPANFTGNLAVGASATFMCSHVMGSTALTNVANSSGSFTPPGGQPTPVTSNNDTAEVLVVHPGFQVTKTVDKAVAAVGDVLTYTITAQNTGDDVLHVSNFDDHVKNLGLAGCDFAAGQAPPANFDLAAAGDPAHGDVRSFTCTHTVAANDPTPYTNVACFDATDGVAPAPATFSECDETTTRSEPALSIVKTVDKATAVDHEVLTYTIVVTNTGHADALNVRVTDLIEGTGHSCGTLSGPAQGGTLAPGATLTYTCTYAVAHGDENPNHDIVNTATATGQTPTGDDIPPVSSTVTTHILHPAIGIDKTGPATAQAGDKVAYTLTVTNPGELSFAEAAVVVTDPICNGDPVTLMGKGGDTTPASFDPGDVWTYTCSVQTKVGDTAIHNVATVVGSHPPADTVTATDDADTTLTQPAQLVLPERIVPGVAKLLGPTGCTAKAFNARVRGTQLASVVFVLDGKVIKRVRVKTAKSTTVALRVNPAKLKIGVHRMVVNITFKSGSGTRPKTMRLSFQRCAKKLAAPRFTG